MGIKSKVQNVLVNTAHHCGLMCRGREVEACVSPPRLHGTAEGGQEACVAFVFQWGHCQGLSHPWSRWWGKKKIPLWSLSSRVHRQTINTEASEICNVLEVDKHYGRNKSRDRVWEDQNGVRTVLNKVDGKLPWESDILANIGRGWGREETMWEDRVEMVQGGSITGAKALRRSLPSMFKEEQKNPGDWVEWLRERVKGVRPERPWEG